MAGVELATAYVSLVVEGSQIGPEVRRRFRQVGGEADRAGRDSGSRFASGMGRAIGAAGLGIGIAGIIKSSVSLEASFSKTMAQIEASTTGAAGSMKELDALAVKMGAETTFSANDAAGAMLELGKSGIDAADIMGGALQGTLLLATAGSTDLATASTIAANAMNTFGLKGKDMAQIAAALAGGANASSASVESLGQALQQVGPGATNAGLSLQETVGVLSAFDAAGVKGSDAGTSLKTMLARLVPQTDKASAAMRKYNLDFTDANGNFVSITNVADQLRKGLGNLSEEQRTSALTTLFGSDATRAATVLMKEGASGIGEYIKATKDQNAAEKLAAANSKGTAGAMLRLQGAVEGAQLALGKALAPTILDVADFLSEDAVPAITEFVTGMQDGTGAGGDVAEVLGDIVSVGKGVFQFFDSMPGPVKKFGVEAGIALLVIRHFAPAFATAKASAIAFGTGLRTAETRMATFRSASKQLAGAAGIGLLISSSHTANQSLGFLGKAAGGALIGATFGPLGAAIGGAAGALYGLATATHDSASEFIDGKVEADKYAESLRGVIDASSAAGRQKAIDVLTNTEGPGGEGIRLQVAAAKKLGIEQRDLVNLITGEAGARNRVLAIAKNAAKYGSGEAQRNAAIVRDLLIPSLDGQRTRLAGVIADNKEYNNQVETLQNLVKQLPPKVQTEIEALNGKATLADIRALAKEYHLSPKKVQTLIEATGVAATVGQILDVNSQLNNLDGKTAKVYIDATVRKFGNLAAEIIGSLNGRATGGPVTAGQPYIVGERRPELFVPNQNGRILPQVPAATASSATSSSTSSQRLYLVLDDGSTLSGYVDSRVGAQGVIDGSKERAFG